MRSDTIPFRALRGVPVPVSLSCRGMLVALFAAVLLSSCSLGTGNLKVRHVDDLRARNIKRIAVLPLDSMAAQPGAYDSTSAPKRALEKNTGTLVTELLYSQMLASPQWQVVSEREMEEVGSKVDDRVPGRAKRLGELVHADAVLFGRVLRFRERVGEDLGVKSPASVAFTLQLLDVKRGEIIWTAEFQETQKPLSENLFALSDFTRRGAKWVKAEELAREGVQKAVEQLNQLLYRRNT